MAQRVLPSGVIRAKCPFSPCWTLIRRPFRGCESGGCRNSDIAESFRGFHYTSKVLNQFPRCLFVGEFDCSLTSLQALMNPLTSILQLVGSGATAYLLSSQIRDEKTRPNVLAGFYFAESGSVPFLTKLRDRAQAEGDTWLAEQLTRHANDERRHGQIFANALKQIGKEPMSPEAMKEAAKADKSENRSPFFDAYYQGYSQDDLKPEVIDWKVFLGSTHILEYDACPDFRRMAQALEGVPGMEKIQAGILSVSDDEERHASYLKEAMQRRYGYLATESLIGEWRSRKVDALMAMVGGLLERRGEMRTMAQDRVGGDVDTFEESLEIPAAA